jgi:hypothetical protein
LVAAAQVEATDFSTTNSDTLVHFWAAAEAKQRPVTVVSFGDSMANSYQSVSCYLMLKFIERFGTAGYSMVNFNNTAIPHLTNGTFTVQGGEYWFSTYLGLPPGGAVWWDNLLTPGGTYCDRAGIFYVSQPQGGQFRLSISTNGGPWTTNLVLDGFSATPTGHFTNLVLTPDRYRLRVDSDLGTNYIIGPSAVMTQTSGVHVVFMDLGGITVGNVTNVPLSIREPIFAALQPDLLLWHMKEPTDLSSGTSNRMEACESWWANSAPDCDVIYIGTPWVALDESSTITPDQNTIVRNIALKHHRAYADLMQPTISYQWLLSNGFMLDPTHLNSAGGDYCANLMWDDLGFFALDLDRKLSLTQTGPQLQLSYNTSASAVYRLEVSTNCQTWTGVFTNPVATATFSTNFVPGTPQSYYRLGLSPN